LPLTFEIETLLLLFADPVVVDVEVGDGELDDVLYGNGAEIMRMDEFIGFCWMWLRNMWKISCHKIQR
jgi:hypothetical protein